MKISSLQKGLVFHASLTQKYYNPATKRVTDLMPYCNHGLSANAASFVNDRMGQPNGAMEFVAASSDYVDCGNVLSNVFSGTNSWSISYWGNYNAAAYSTPFSKYDVSGLEAGVHLQNSEGRLRLADGAGNTFDNAITGSFGGNLAGTGCNHIILIYDGINVYVHVNDVLKTTVPWSYGIGDTSGTNFYIGKNEWNNYFNGSIADVRIWKRVINTEERTFLAESYNPKLVIG